MITKTIIISWSYDHMYKQIAIIGIIENNCFTIEVSYWFSAMTYVKQLE